MVTHLICYWGKEKVMIFFLLQKKQGIFKIEFSKSDWKLNFLKMIKNWVFRKSSNVGQLKSSVVYMIWFFSPNRRFCRGLGSAHSRSWCCPIYTRLIFQCCSLAWLTSGEREKILVREQNVVFHHGFSWNSSSNSSWHSEITKGLNSELIKHDRTSKNTCRIFKA